MKYLLQLAFLCLLLGSCEKTEIEDLGVFDPFAEEEEGPNNPQGASFGSVVYYHPTSKRIIHVNTATSTSSAVVTNLPSVGRLTLSFDKKKLAFINSQGNVEVWSMDGNLINTIDETSSIADVNWAPDNSTLIYLVDGLIKKSNASYSLPNYIPIANATKVDLSVSIDGDLAISYYGQQGFSTFQIVEIFRQNGDEMSITPTAYLPTTINFANNSGNYISLYGNNASTGKGNTVYSLFQNTPNQTAYFSNQNQYNSIQSSSNESMAFIKVGGAAELYFVEDGIKTYKLTSIQSSALTELVFDWKY